MLRPRQGPAGLLAEPETYGPTHHHSAPLDPAARDSRCSCTTSPQRMRLPEISPGRLDTAPPSRDNAGWWRLSMRLAFERAPGSHSLLVALCNLSWKSGIGAVSVKMRRWMGRSV